jgi:hypothetical protein
MSAGIVRSFAFVDLCGFTEYMDAHGTDLAVEALTIMRTAVSARQARCPAWPDDCAT